MISICIIEDIPEIQNGLKYIIDSDDRFLLLKCFSNAEEAMEELPQLAPQIVIADINLPGRSGIECVQVIKAKVPDIQFIMFTIYDDNDQVFEAIKAGANGYILKNTPPEKILESLIDLSEGGSPMTAKIARKVIANMQKGETTAYIDELTQRENEVLVLLSKGFLYKEIADKLGISASTVKSHLSHIYQRLQVQNKTEAINKMYNR
ncbi:MAG TPA: response regulator transcription factor [Ferruginibacter sp.]|jgi:RNA polymerase sigma factor (sigma-70 family)|nr:response regulator transcription factor [Ferruginibacter sp.]